MAHGHDLRNSLKPLKNSPLGGYLRGPFASQRSVVRSRGISGLLALSHPDIEAA